MDTTANIFDPVSNHLDQNVFKGTTPRKRVTDFIKRIYLRAFDQELTVSNGEDYVSLYLTGSLTTYQFSDTSDADVSIFPEYEKIYRDLGLDAHDIRKELIAMSIEHLDGTFLPGSSHPLQFFVVDQGILPGDLYKPGLRSAYSLDDKIWVVAPEKDRVHDIEVELPEVYARAAEIADKMTEMLDHDPEQARQLWHLVHQKRQLDQRAGLGDFSEGNIVYKYLLHQGLFDRIQNELNEYIAQVKTSEVTYDTPGQYEEDVYKFVWFKKTNEVRVWRDSEHSNYPENNLVAHAYVIKKFYQEEASLYNWADYYPYMFNAMRRGWVVPGQLDLMDPDDPQILYYSLGVYLDHGEDGYEGDHDPAIDTDKLRAALKLPTAEVSHYYGKVSMAERSGDPQLDALLESFQVTYLIPSMRNTLLRDPQWAEGMCEDLAEEFAKFLNWHGVDAENSSYRNENIEWIPTHPDDLGYQDRPIPGYYQGHAVTWIEKDGQDYMVDWTAAQYGYKEFPMVQKLDDNRQQWQREWTAAIENDPSGLRIEVNDPENPWQPKLPQKVIDQFVAKMECPHCQSSLRKDLNVGIYCPYCGWEYDAGFGKIAKPGKNYCVYGDGDRAYHWPVIDGQFIAGLCHYHNMLYIHNMLPPLPDWVSDYTRPQDPSLFNQGTSNKQGNSSEKALILYDFERDRIILGTGGVKTPQKENKLPDSKIIGEYENGEATLYEAEKQWVNPAYFRRLWNYSYPKRHLKEVYYQSGENKTKLKIKDHKHLDKKSDWSTRVRAFIYNPIDDKMYFGDVHPQILRDEMGYSYRDIWEWDKILNQLVFGEILSNDTWQILDKSGMGYKELSEMELQQYENRIQTKLDEEFGPVLKELEVW